MAAQAGEEEPYRNGRRLGRYVLFQEIASGGTATVHLGRLLGPAGFTRTVAIKRLHAMFAKDPEFISMFLDEARIAARIRHPNVATTLDVVELSGELFLVMEFVHGESLSRLVRALHPKDEAVPPSIAVAVVIGVLEGLHAAHEARDERGEPLAIVHRDVSPQNVLVGVDGTARVVDFGIAKARGRLQTTLEGQVKGKPAYMAPEQVRGREVDRRTDVYAASVVLWEMLAGRRLFVGDDALGVMARVLDLHVPAPSATRPEVTQALDAIVLRGLSRDAADRFPTAREMAVALEKTSRAATSRDVGEWVERLAADMLAERAKLIADVESSTLEKLGLPLDAASSGVPVDATMRVLSADSTAITTTSLSAHHRSRSARGWRRPVGIAAFLVTLLGFIVLSRSNVRPRRTVEVQAVSSVLSPSTEPRPLAVASSSPAAPLSPVAPVSPIMSAVTAVSSSTPVSRPTRSKGPRAAAPPASKASEKQACDPPYTMGPDGLRQPKLECM